MCASSLDLTNKLMCIWYKDSLFLCHIQILRFRTDFLCFACQLQLGETDIVSSHYVLLEGNELYFLYQKLCFSILQPIIYLSLLAHN